MTVIRWLIHPPPPWVIRLAAGGLILGALLGSLVPGMGPPSEHDIDKMVHVLGYAALAFTLGEIRGSRWPLALVLAVGMGGLVELLQTAIPEREGSWSDFLANDLGVLLGLSVQVTLTRIRTKVPRPADGPADPSPPKSGGFP